LLKPESTIAIGRNLVRKELEKRGFEVFKIAKHNRVHFLVKNKTTLKEISLSIKTSKDYSQDPKYKKSRDCFKLTSWYLIKRTNLESSKVDFLVFVLHSAEKETRDFVIISPSELLNSLNILKRFKGDRAFFYITTTTNGTAFDTRELIDEDLNLDLICSNNFSDENRDLTKYLNNWDQINEDYS